MPSTARGSVRRGASPRPVGLGSSATAREAGRPARSRLRGFGRSGGFGSWSRSLSGWWSAPRPGRGPFALELDVLLSADARRDELTAVLAGCAVPVAAAQELHRVGDDVHRLALAPVLGLPLAPLQATVDRDRAALGEVSGDVFALPAPDGDVEVVGLVDPLLAVLAAGVAGDPQAAHRGSARRRAQLGVGGQVAGDDDSVDVVHCLFLLLVVVGASDAAQKRRRPARGAGARKGAGKPPAGGPKRYSGGVQNGARHDVPTTNGDCLNSQSAQLL